MKNKSTDTLYFFNLPKILETRIVIGKNVKNIFPRHVHDSYCIGIVDDGIRLIEKKQDKQLIHRNKIFVINPGVPHKCKSLHDQGHSYRAISIKPHIVETIASKIGKKRSYPPYFKNVLIDDPAMTRCINCFFSCLQSEESIFEKKAKLTAFISELISKYSKKQLLAVDTSKSRQAVKCACEYIRSNYNEKVSLNRLSEKAGLSPFHFQKVFLKEKGISPNDYLFKVRIDIASAMLHQGVSIADVSVATGFTDQSHFTRRFKKVMGITPGRYLQLAGFLCKINQTVQLNI